MKAILLTSAALLLLLHMKLGTVRVWPAPRPFTSIVVGNTNVLDAKPSDGGNADLVISAQEEGSGNIILTDEQGRVIADIQVRVRDPMPREDKVKRVPLSDLMVEVPPSNSDGK
jgi:Flp pilus assembly secretin CpaC